MAREYKGLVLEGTAEGQVHTSSYNILRLYKASKLKPTSYPSTQDKYPAIEEYVYFEFEFERNLFGFWVPIYFNRQKKTYEAVVAYVMEKLVSNYLRPSVRVEY